jgi:hypothetical protein
MKQTCHCADVRYRHNASVCPEMADGRLGRKADIVQHWREMARSRITQSEYWSIGTIHDASDLTKHF